MQVMLLICVLCYPLVGINMYVHVVGYLPIPVNLDLKHTQHIPVSPSWLRSNDKGAGASQSVVMELVVGLQ